MNPIISQLTANSNLSWGLFGLPTNCQCLMTPGGTGERQSSIHNATSTK